MANTKEKLIIDLPLDNVIFKKSMLINSPSRLDGCTLEDEIKLRIVGCEIIQHAGRLLELPQPVVATAQILFQRFYLKRSILIYNIEIFAIASILLAGKCEENIRRIRDVINVFKYIQDKTILPEKNIDPFEYYGMDYIKLKSFVVGAERRILKELGFLVHVQHPHKWIVSIMKIIGCEENTQLLQKAWNYMNDSLKTPIFLFYQAQNIACSCIYLASLNMNIPLPNNPSWWLIFNVEENELVDISKQIMYLYTLPKLSLIDLINSINKKLDNIPCCKYERILLNTINFIEKKKI